MKLTPIKVKGKAGPKKTWRPPVPKRSLKRPRDETEQGDDINEGPRRRRIKSKKPAAPIEELPTELLERIILMSRNLNFLRASFRIGYRFSSPAFLTELLEAAFAPTWDLWLGHNKNALTNDHYLLQPEWIPGDPDFQSAVLACKWANTALILSAQQKWYRRNGGPGRLTSHLPEPDHLRLSPVHFDRSTDLAALFEQDWQTFKRSCAEKLLPSPASSAEKKDDRTSPAPREGEGELNHLELHPLSRIPDRVLAGPFDWETARTTYWLVRGGARLLESHTWSWELTKRGYDRIMALEDTQLAMVLLVLQGTLHAFEHWPEFLTEQELEEVERRVERAATLDARQLWWYAGDMITGHHAELRQMGDKNR